MENKCVESDLIFSRFLFRIREAVKGLLTYWDLQLIRIRYLNRFDIGSKNEFKCKPMSFFEAKGATKTKHLNLFRNYFIKIWKEIVTQEESKEKTDYLDWNTALCKLFWNKSKTIVQEKGNFNYVDLRFLSQHLIVLAVLEWLATKACSTYAYGIYNSRKNVIRRRWEVRCSSVSEVGILSCLVGSKQFNVSTWEFLIGMHRNVMGRILNINVKSFRVLALAVNKTSWISSSSRCGKKRIVCLEL